MLTIFLLCLSVLCLGYAAFAAQGRGPLLSVHTPDEGTRIALRVRSEYRAIAAAFLGFGLCLASFACLFQFGLPWLAWLSVALSAAVAGGAGVLCVRTLR